MKRPLLFCLAALLLPVCAMPASARHDLAALLTRGDSLFQQFEYDDALRLYTQADSLYPDHYDVLTRLCNTYPYFAESLKTKGRKTLARAALKMGVERAEELKRRYPDEAQAYFYLAFAKGERALAQGARAQAQIAVELVRDLKRSIALDSTYAPAYAALGATYRALAKVHGLERTLAKALTGDIPKATDEDAVAMLQRAIALDPGLVTAPYELALTYAHMKRQDEAVDEMRKVLALAPRTIVDVRFQTKARALLDHWTA